MMRRCRSRGSRSSVAGLILLAACSGDSTPIDPTPLPELTVGFPEPATGESIIAVQRNAAIGCDAILSPPSPDYRIEWIVDGGPAVCESRPTGAPTRLYEAGSGDLITLSGGGFEVEVILLSPNGAEVERQRFLVVILAGH